MSAIVGTRKCRWRIRHIQKRFKVGRAEILLTLAIGCGDWIAKFNVRFLEFSISVAETSAKAAFMEDRAKRLRAAAAGFDEKRGQLDPNSPSAKKKASALRGQSLSWQGDMAMPEALEYEMIYGQHGFSVIYSVKSMD